MLPNTEEPLAAQLGSAPGALLTGDPGLVVLRALLENGVGYVVGAWQDQPTPLDAAIHAARGGLLARRGITTRRLRSLATLAPLVTSPTLLAGGPDDVAAVPRGAVVFGGRRGMVPTLTEFASLVVPGGVVGFCFDPDAVRITDAIVIEPEQTARGLVDAIDLAFAASVRSGRPALVLVRDRLLGMRGTIRCRTERAPLDAALADAASPRELSASAASAISGLVTLDVPDDARVARRLVIVAGVAATATRRALELLAATHAPLERELDETAILTLRAPGLHDALPAMPDSLRDVKSVLVVGGPAQDERLRRIAGMVPPHATVTHAPLDADRFTGRDVATALARWMDVSTEPIDVDADVARRASRVATRIPRRGEQLHRGVPAPVAAGLTLAQGVVGVPTRIAPTHATYMTDTGVPLTIADAAAFAATGAALAAPGSAAGVFVVSGSAAGLAERAAAASMSIEYVDGASPRAVGSAIGRACRAPRATSHVIVATPVTRAAAPSRSTLGIDPELLGTDRIAVAAVPMSATTVVEYEGGLLGGPVQLPLDTPDVVAHAPVLRELSPASWDLRVVQRSGASRWSDLRWSMRRRFVRSIGGTDL